MKYDKKHRRSESQYLPGNSRKLDVLLWRPRVDAWNASGPISSLEKMEVLETALFKESRELRRLAKYARPPLELPRRLGLDTTGTLPSLISVKSLVDFRHRDKDTTLSEQVRSKAVWEEWMICWNKETELFKNVKGTRIKHYIKLYKTHSKP